MQSLANLSDADAAAAIVGRTVSYSPESSRVLPDGGARTFTIVTVEHVANAIKTGFRYAKCSVIDHNDGEAVKERNLRLDSILAFVELPF